MKKLAVAVTILSITVIGCATTSGPSATAVMEPKSGSNVSGTVTFEEIFEGTVRVTVDLKGVPEGVHGFHVHEFGNCNSDDGKSAGGHFNRMHAGVGQKLSHPVCRSREDGRDGRVVIIEDRHLEPLPGPV